MKNNKREKVWSERYVFGDEQRDQAVRNIAQQLGVSELFAVMLYNRGYVTADADGFLTLTEEGLKAAKDIFERHTVLTRFLTSLGVSAEVAAEDACKIEHVISQESFDALKSHLK